MGSWKLTERAGSSQSQLGAPRACWELPGRAGRSQGCKLPRRAWSPRSSWELAGRAGSAQVELGAYRASCEPPGPAGSSKVELGAPRSSWGPLLGWRFFHSCNFFNFFQFFQSFWEGKMLIFGLFYKVLLKKLRIYGHTREPKSLIFLWFYKVFCKQRVDKYSKFFQ